MKLTMSLFLALAFGLAFGLAAQGQSNSPVEMPSATTTATEAIPANGNLRNISLGECIGLALEKNLDLRIERYNPDLAVFNLSIARGSAYDPVFTATGQYEHDRTTGLFVAGTNAVPNATADANTFGGNLSGSLPWGMSYNLDTVASERDGDSWNYSGSNFLNSPFDTSHGEARITLTQPLLRNSWVDRNRYSISVAKNRVKYSEQSLRQQLIKTLTDVEYAYYELIYARENVKVQEKSLQLAAELLQENKKRVEVGVMAPLDEKQAESQMAARRADLIVAQRGLATRQNVLKSLITDDYVTWHDLNLQPTEPLLAQQQFYNLHDSWSRGLSSRPDLLQSKLDLERAGIQLKYDRNQVFPQLDLFGTYGRFGNGDQLNDTYSQIREDNDSYYVAGIQFSVPLGNVAARNRYKSTKVTVEQGVLALKKSEQSVMVQIDEAILLAKSSYESVQANHEASVFAEAALDAEQKKLENGKSTNFEVLRLQNDLTSARSAEIRSLANYNEALAALSQAEASTLERHKIDVNVK